MKRTMVYVYPAGVNENKEFRNNPDKEFRKKFLDDCISGKRKPEVNKGLNMQCWDNSNIRKITLYQFEKMMNGDLLNLESFYIMFVNEYDDTLHPDLYIMSYGFPLPEHISSDLHDSNIKLLKSECDLNSVYLLSFNRDKYPYYREYKPGDKVYNFSAEGYTTSLEKAKEFERRMVKSVSDGDAVNEKLRLIDEPWFNVLKWS